MSTTAISQSAHDLPSAGTWRLDASHSQVEFSVKHLMISTVRGRFGTVDATVVVPEQGTPEVRVEIAAASVDTNAEQRDAHLRSADFFDADAHPKITFVGRTVERRGDELQLTGDLTIRGVTRPVSLVVEPLGAARDPWGNEKVAFGVTGKINRRDFGLVWNQGLETGGVLVGDEVKLTAEVQFAKS